MSCPINWTKQKRKGEQKMENTKKQLEQFNKAQTSYILTVMSIYKENGNKHQIELIDLLERGLEDLKDYI